MILALFTNSQKWQSVSAAIRRYCGMQTFDSTIALQSWMEINGLPSGLVIDLSDAQFEDFLIRFSLRHPEIPFLTLIEQPEEKLLLRARAFVNRSLKPISEKSLAKILLVDDSKTVRRHYHDALSRAGYHVDVAGDAQEGFDKASSTHYDLAIIDYFMPDSNGAELVKKLKNQERTFDLFCSILTGQYEQQLVDECLKAGAQECMFKNESFDLFLTRVHALIRSVQRKRQAENERSRLIGLLYSVSEGVYGVTPDGRIQFVNPATLNLLGQTLSNLMGHFPHDCIHPVGSDGQPTSRDACLLQQAYTQNEELRCWRTVFQRSDNTLFPVECNINPLQDSKGHSGTVVVFRDNSELRRMEKNWQWQLTHDQLTGILNRGAFEEILSNTISRAKRMNEKSLLMFIDLDKFKSINDKMGHAAGDKLLVTLSRSLVSVARDSDYVGRQSGDEFLVLCIGVEENDLSTIAEKFRIALESTVLQWEGNTIQVTGSIGATWIDSDSIDSETVLSQADIACALSKQKGRNQWLLYRNSFEKNEISGNWINRLEKALDESNFILFRQAVVSTKEPSDRVGYSCLFQLKEGDSVISPELYQSSARRFGFSVKVDEAAIDLLIKKLASISEQHKDKLWYSLPFCTETIAQEGFPNWLSAQWKKSGLSPKSLRIVVSESEMLNLIDGRERLKALQLAGFSTVVSHFGTNLQTLLNLQQWPIHAIELDSSLTDRLDESPICGNVIDALTRSANLFGIRVQAVRVGSASALEKLKLIGVDEVQGNHIASGMSFL